MNLSSILEDADVMESGGWIDDIPGLDGVRLRVRGLRSSVYLKAEAKAYDSVPRSQKANGLKMEVIRNTQDRLLREVILLGWAGITDENGALPFTPENVTKLLGAPVFRDAVTYAAGLIGTPEWREEETKKAAAKPKPAAGPIEAAA